MKEGKRGLILPDQVLLHLLLLITRCAVKRTGTWKLCKADCPGAERTLLLLLLKSCWTLGAASAAGAGDCSLLIALAEAVCLAAADDDEAPLPLFAAYYFYWFSLAAAKRVYSEEEEVSSAEVEVEDGKQKALLSALPPRIECFVCLFLFLSFIFSFRPLSLRLLFALLVDTTTLFHSLSGNKQVSVSQCAGDSCCCCSRCKYHIFLMVITVSNFFSFWSSLEKAKQIL